MTNRLFCFNWLMTRGGVSPPYPPQWISGTQSRTIKQCYRTLWRPGMDRPLDSQGPSRGPPWLLRGDPGPPTARRKDTNVSLRFADLRFCTPSVAFRTLWRSDLSRNGIKTNNILTMLKLFVSISVFFIPRRPKGPSETPFWTAVWRLWGPEGPP